MLNTEGYTMNTESQQCPSRGCENTIGDGSVVPLDRSMCGDCWAAAERRIEAFRRIVEREEIAELDAN